MRFPGMRTLARAGCILWGKESLMSALMKRSSRGSRSVCPAAVESKTAAFPPGRGDWFGTWRHTILGLASLHRS